MTDTSLEIFTHSEVTPEVIQAHNSARKLVTKRVAFFENDGVTPWEPERTSKHAIEASVSVDASRDERRNITLSLYNPDGVFDNRIDGFWYDKVIKAYRGLKYKSRSGALVHFEHQLGEFMIDQIDSDSKTKVVAVTGRDYTKRLLLDEFDEPTTFNEGTTVDDLVKTIALNGGVTKFNLNSGGVNVTAPASFEAETPRWEAITEICTPYNVEVYFNNLGELTTRLKKDPTTAEDGDLVLNTRDDLEDSRNLITASYSSSDGSVFNVVRVYATGDQGESSGHRFVAIRSNDDPASPTSIQRIGRRPISYSSDLFTSQQQVDDFADGYLKVNALQEFSLSFDTVVYPWLEGNDILKLYEQTGNSIGPVRYLLTEFTIPVGLGAMSGTSKRITQVGFVDEV